MFISLGGVGSLRTVPLLANIAIPKTKITIIDVKTEKMIMNKKTPTL